MYCRNCGSICNDKAEICIKCGCRPLNGNEYCQECGSDTNERQEICIKCGFKLRKSSDSFYQNIVEGFSFSSNEDIVDVNSEFLSLSPYYQQEFTKIMNSNEQYKGKFNWCAFLFGGIWAFSKGLWLSAIVCIVLSSATAGIGGVIYWFIYGIRGNYMYYCKYVKSRQCIF